MLKNSLPIQLTEKKRKLFAGKKNNVEGICVYICVFVCAPLLLLTAH